MHAGMEMESDERAKILGFLTSTIRGLASESGPTQTLTAPNRPTRDSILIKRRDQHVRIPKTQFNWSQLAICIRRSADGLLLGGDGG